MTTTPKQRSIRFDDALQERLEQMATEENRTFSAQVVWLVRQALAQQAFTQKQPAPSGRLASSHAAA
jgi:predicted transcriptional regulator